MLTPLRFTTKSLVNGEPGTGKVNGEEVYPVTPSLLARLRIDQKIKDEIILQQQGKVFKDYNKDERLRPYQVEDAEFLAARKSAGCFNEQRTGKTPTICNVVRMKELKKTLIICPASMVYPWQDAYEEWAKQSCLTLLGTPKKKQEIVKNWTEGMVVSYETLRETLRKKEDDGVLEYYYTGMIDYVLKHKDIDCLIVDEAHRLQDPNSNQSKAVFQLRKVPNKYTLTGTPAPNKAYQIYSSLHLLHPTIFTGFWRFIDYYFYQPKKYIGNGKFIADKKNFYFKPGKEQELQEWLDVISTQRKRKEVMQWLPDKEYLYIKLEPTDYQQKCITEMSEDFETEDVMAVNTLDSLIKERQMCNCPSLVGLKESSPKLQWIKQYIKDYPDKPILIFSKFTKWLDLLHKELGADLITGPVPLKKRKELCDQFQSGKINILLINIDAGKEGLTLDRAEASIFTDRYLPVGSLEQAEDRFVATKKELAHKEHQVIIMLMKNTYEENIELMIKNNSEEIDVINDYKKYLESRRIPNDSSSKK